MKKAILFSIALGASLVFFGCKNQNEKHEHGPDTHTHGPDTHTHNDDYFGAYGLEDEKFGTKTNVSITEDQRIMVTNSLPNHRTGTFPRKGNPNTISAQDKVYHFPLHPKYTGKATWIREPGIALNGIKFEPGTGEVVTCESGENYRVEAFQNLIDLGLDFNHAHVQPTGAYHYHGSPTTAIELFDTGEDLVHIGFAHDGFPMYYSKSEIYKSSFKAIDGNREGEDCSYNRPELTMDVAVGGHHDGTFTSDYEYVPGSGDLDECNGITVDGQYMYIITNTFPYVSRCLMGEFESQERNGPPGNGGGPPSVEQLFEMMDANTDEKLSNQEVDGPLKDDFNKIDVNNDGFLTKEELEKAPKK